MLDCPFGLRIMKIRKEYTCPLELTHDLIKGKWKPIIIWNLQETKTLSELEKSIIGISQKMLIQHVNELLDYKIISKYKYPGYPLKIELSLTERGKKLLQAIIVLQQIGVDIQNEGE